MSDYKSNQIKSVLKDLLKQKKLSYLDVADQLECSVPTIKRILGPEELSLPRLLLICELVDIDLGDLQSLINIGKKETKNFTPKQEEFLAKNSHFLAYFIALFSESPEKIAQKNGLTDRSTDKYLLILEKYELIKVTSKFKVKPSFNEVPRLGNGALGRTYFRSLIKAGSDFFVSEISEAMQNFDSKKTDITPQGLGIQAAKCTKASYTQFIKEQNKAKDAFIKLAGYEEKTIPESDLSLAVILDAHACVSLDNQNIALIENTFGKIKNL